MTATLIEARDDIFALIKTAWDSVGFADNMIWPDVSENIPIASGEPWARTTFNITDRRQASLHNDGGLVRYGTIGFTTIQIFTPIGDGQVQNITIGQTMLDGLEGKSTPNGVWFRNVRYNQVGASGDFLQANVITEFSFDEVK